MMPRRKKKLSSYEKYSLFKDQSKKNPNQELQSVSKGILVTQIFHI